MPVYETEELPREKLEELRRKNVCAVCGGWLNMFLGEGGVAFVACNDWLRTHHDGTKKEARIFEPNIPTRRKQMETEHGTEKTTALAKYVGTAAITKKVATDIVETLWGGAPLIEKTKCILLCQTYQLNPLMKHLYLVGYKRYKDKKVVVDDQGNPVLDWSIQIGIGATRLLAQRRHHYSYLDFTPRKATQVEIDKILGDEADPACIYGFVHIKDQDSGAEAFGLRGIEKNANIKGTEKGNTHLNMACVRSERLALDRQYPGEMPSDVEVVDERYIEGEYQVTEDEALAEAAREVLKKGGELKVGTYLGKIDGKPLYYGLDGAGNEIKGDREAAESPADVRAREQEEAKKAEAARPEPEPEPEEMQGPTLEELKKVRDRVDAEITRREAKENISEETAVTEEPPPAPEPEPPPAKDETPITSQQLNALDAMMKKTGVTLTQLGKCIKKDKGWKAEKLGELKCWQFNELMAAFEKGQEQPPPEE